MNWLSRTGSRVAAVFKAAPARPAAVQDRGWFTLFDTFTGSWQQDVKVERDSVVSNWAVFSCMTLIAQDIGKCCLRLLERSEGIWLDASNPAYSPVLRKPNGWQTLQQFLEAWVLSLLSWGNTYVLKERDARGVVVGLYVLHPQRVNVLVSESGEVFYQLETDSLSGISEPLPAVPASEIVHDRINCLFHPLVGLSPIFASGLAAMGGLSISNNLAKFFANMSRPSGLLTAPASISDEVANRLKDTWHQNYGGKNVGKVAVLGDGLKYEPMGLSPEDAQMNELLKSSAEMICSTFHVPAFKIGAGTIPAGQKVEDLNQIYYADCLHARMHAIEGLLGEGLRLDPAYYRLGFDLDDLLRMDQASFATVLGIYVDKALMSPNEARLRLNLPPVPGGYSPLAQQQDYSLAALAKRDAKDDPFASGSQPSAASDNTAGDAEQAPAVIEALAAQSLRKHLRAA